MFLFFKTFDNTLLPTGSPAVSNTSSKNFPCTLFGSAYETDTSPLPTTVARSAVCQYVFFDPLLEGWPYYFKQWDQPMTPQEATAKKNMWAKRLRPSSPRPVTPQMLSLWFQGCF
ncbi:hypothetical protein I350_04157 [Cryptococcus amylolentus CBS 6273]|uniref:Uncharacterized protein n=1 Tax=Cryptococcus amylolentus CBS 6273 TaxID=1296118 RepID=A0A1E3K0W7_9TREE|nr:hypothetical protein I350_04157 [Cryptococcus amylolentus CBS 6273]